MNWTLLAIALAVLALIGVGGWLVVKMFFNYLDRQIELASRGMAVEERKVALEESRVRGPAVPASMPPDLMRRVNAWQDIDARDQERKVLLDLFAELQDWDKVRAALPQSPDDTIPEHPDLGLVA